MINILKIGKVIEQMQKDLNPMVGKVNTMDVDLYGNLKETAQLKYRIVELELRLSNLETMAKLLTKGEV